MNKFTIIYKDFILDIVRRNGIEDKFYKQIYKLQNGFFDKGVNFEKIKASKDIFFYSFRININYRGYIRIEGNKMIIFDVNNHNYEIIKKTLSNLNR